MKAKCIIKRVFLLTIVFGLFTAFYSCSDDDNNGPKPPVTVKDVEGNYTGKLLMSHTNQTGKSGIATTAKVEKDTVYFDKIPVDTLIYAIYGHEFAEKILKETGDVKYKIGYTSGLNAAKDSVLLSLKPKNLVVLVKFPIDYPEKGSDPQVKRVDTVKVSFPAEDHGTYSARIMKFKMQTTSIEHTSNISLEKPQETIPSKIFNFELNKN